MRKKNLILEIGGVGWYGYGGKNSRNEDDGNFPNHSCVANPGGKQSVSAFWRTEKSKIAESQRHSKEKLRA